MQIASIRHTGVLAALGSAFLFGAATPLAKSLLNTITPWMLAGLLYLGSGIGLFLYRQLTHASPVSLKKPELLCLAASVFSGGVVGPVLLMIGLKGSTATNAALLLNMEGVFTSLLAWFVFKENFDKRIALGMLSVVVGAIVLSWPGKAGIEAVWPSLAILGACMAWGIDNNLTRKVSLSDASWIVSIKGTTSGCVNILLAFIVGAELPDLPTTAAALLLGLLSYGVSLVLFVVGLRHLGTARTGAYFSVAPFFGAVLALLMGEPFNLSLLLAGLLMAFGVWLHLSEDHTHLHTHDAVEHEHDHTHDEHHIHAHHGEKIMTDRHSHLHRHEKITHTHQHFPDAHHLHRH